MNEPVLFLSTSDVVSHATRSQRIASNPSYSAWVSASAGSGKTSVLTNRVLRLLLPDKDGCPGANPNSILCLTYTRAAAAEMEDRLSRRLGSWAILPEDELSQEISEISGETPTENQISAARALFSRFTAGTRSTKIMTIHAFCQSLLARFPFEAGIPVHFTLIEGETCDLLMKESWEKLIASVERDALLRLSLEDLLKEVSEETLFTLSKDISGRYLKLFSDIRPVFDLPEGMDPRLWSSTVTQEATRLLPDFSFLASVLIQGGVNEKNEGKFYFRGSLP